MEQAIGEAISTIVSAIRTIPAEYYAITCVILAILLVAYLVGSEISFRRSKVVFDDVLRELDQANANCNDLVHKLEQADANRNDLVRELEHKNDLIANSGRLIFEADEAKEALKESADKVIAVLNKKCALMEAQIDTLEKQVEILTPYRENYLTMSNLASNSQRDMMAAVKRADATESHIGALDNSTPALSVPSSSAFTLPAPSEKVTIRTKIVGVMFKNDDGSERQEAISDLEVGERLFLQDLTSFEYPNAIGVFNYLDIQLGHLRDELAGDIRRRYINTGKNTIESIIVEVLDVTGSVESNYGCNIELTLNR